MSSGTQSNCESFKQLGCQHSDRVECDDTPENSHDGAPSLSMTVVVTAQLALLLGLAACARPRPIAPTSTTHIANHTPSQPAASPLAIAAPLSAPVHAPPRSASELIEWGGSARFLALRQLKVASINVAAMERWFERKPSRVFVYSEYPIELSATGASIRLRCRGNAQAETVVSNGLSAVLWQDRRSRMVLKIGQSDVAVEEQTFERGQWQISGVRSLPMKASTWDDAHIRYSEGAAIHEVACVPVIRSVPCDEAHVGPHGYCIDQDLVVRPWHPSTVLATGRVVDSSPDVSPEVPAGNCTVQCELGACGEALRREHLPRQPLYAEDAAVLAVFKSESVCLRFAAARERARTTP